MSKRDYEKIAACIAERAKYDVPGPFGEGWHGALLSVAMNLVDVFKEDNPNFDTDAFLNATEVRP